jgi:hypothetical protein
VQVEVQAVEELAAARLARRGNGLAGGRVEQRAVEAAARRSAGATCGGGGWRRRRQVQHVVDGSRSVGSVMNQRGLCAARCCRKATAPSAAFACGTAVRATACSSGFIQNVISSLKYEAVPAANTMNSTQPTSRPDQVCSHAIDWRKPSFMRRAPVMRTSTSSSTPSGAAATTRPGPCAHCRARGKDPHHGERKDEKGGERAGQGGFAARHAEGGGQAQREHRGRQCRNAVAAGNGGHRTRSHAQAVANAGAHDARRTASEVVRKFMGKRGKKEKGIA